MTRYLQALSLLLLLAFIVCSCQPVMPIEVETPTEASITSFKIVALTDTQMYTSVVANQPLFAQQTQWIVDNLETENIRFVTHVGDVVQDEWSPLTLEDQWTIADAAMGILDGKVPYSVSYGNHDFDDANNFSGSTTTAQSWFGAERYQDYPWFGGASPDGDNLYQVFTAGGYDFLHINLNWYPDQAAFDWAQAVLESNPGMPTILTSHAYLTYEGGGKRDWLGERIWENLVKSNDQIFMVIGGHFCCTDSPQVSGEYTEDGEYHQISINDAGHEVYELLADYQGYPNGGDGWLQLIEFDLSNDSINVSTYSPFLDAYQTDAMSQYSFGNNLSDRLSQAAGDTVD